ncbi:MAG: hypothetical protein GY820_42715 [Gammaproteobacteria bacterium]|nr:hypothetical protein [Gammaproteobacteria bacterium]
MSWRLWGNMIADSLIPFISIGTSLIISLGWVCSLWGPKFGAIAHLLGTVQQNYHSSTGDNETE